jgi:hypothetical protein
VLDRSKKELKEWDADILSKKWLKKLYLFQNHITTIPGEVAEFTDLQALSPLPLQLLRARCANVDGIGGNVIFRRWTSSTTASRSGQRPSARRLLSLNCFSLATACEASLRPTMYAPFSWSRPSLGDHRICGV